MNRFLASRPRRVFDKWNPLWNNSDRKQNPLFVCYVKDRLNDILQARGYVLLNEALELLGFERTVQGGQQGWLRDPEPGEGDGFIEFGTWAEGFTRGKEWLHGELDLKTLYFNVDRTTISMPRRIQKQRTEGKIR